MTPAGTSHHSADTSGLAGQIDALISGMADSAAALAADESSGRIESAVGSDDPRSAARGSHRADAAGGPLSATEVEALSTQIDALVEDVAAARGVPSDHATGGAADDGIDLDSLDAQLAAQAPASEPVRPAPLAAAASLDRVPEPEPVEQTAPPPPESAAVSSLGVGPIATPVRAQPRRSAARAAAAATAIVRAARTTRDVSARVMSASPQIVRDTAGWIGLVTLFAAGSMWAFTLFFRAPGRPEVVAPASAVLEPGQPTPQPRARDESTRHGVR